MANLTRWNPFDEFANFLPHDLLGRDLFTRVRPGGAVGVEWSPRCDVTEGDGAIIVHAELPGVEAKDIEVSVSGAQLTIRGEKRTESKSQELGRTYSERFFGSFERTVSIPAGVDQSKIEANLKEGVLVVRVPVPATPQAETNKIRVKAS